MRLLIWIDYSKRGKKEYEKIFLQDENKIFTSIRCNKKQGKEFDNFFLFYKMKTCCYTQPEFNIVLIVPILTFSVVIKI